MPKSIRIHDDPPPLPDGYEPVGFVAHWQKAINRISWYVQRRMGLEQRFPAHVFTTLFSMSISASGAALLYLTPITSGVVHWILLGLCVPIVPPALWFTITTIGVFYEKA
jgi:hypothetical protein